jgi:hypothetical protein
VALALGYIDRLDEQLLAELSSVCAVLYAWLRSQAIECGGDAVEAVPKPRINRVDVIESLCDIETCPNLLRRCMRAPKPKPRVAVRASVSLRSIERDACRSPSQLPSKVSIVLPNLLDDRSHNPKRFNRE